MSEELLPCPFCGDETGRSSTLCGHSQGKWWCKNQDYLERTLPASVTAVLAALENIAEAKENMATLIGDYDSAEDALIAIVVFADNTLKEYKDKEADNGSP